MSIPALSTTTLSAAIDARQTRITVASSTGINGLGSLTSPQSILVVGGEAMRVLNVPVSGVLEVTRGTMGTQARAHASGATVTFAAATKFDFERTGGAAGGVVGLVGTPGSLPDYRLPVGIRVVDPATGYEYVLVDATAAIDAGEWVVISGTGTAALLSSTSKGRVGVAVEAAGASDTLIWVLVVGAYVGANTDTDVTTSGVMIGGGTAGEADEGTTSGGNYIYGASCTAAPVSSVGDTGTVYLNNPWVFGTATYIQNASE